MSAAPSLTSEGQKATAPPLTHSSILKFFTPLALSWIFMSVEGPVSVAIISRLPNPTINTAAFQMMMSLALWIESPVIDLLSTSTTLAHTRQNYIAISRFVWYLLGAVTFVHASIVFTPLYNIVSEHLLGVSPEIAKAARLGLMLMLPWSGFIGWRRYLQGILIRNGQTKWVGLGTFIRVATIIVVSSSLYFTTKLEGIQIAATALISSVGAEAFFIHWASRRTIAVKFSKDTPGEVLEQKKLASFHLPLTATTMVMLTGGPIVTAALSHVPNSVNQLAAYQVASTLVWLMRTTVYALPETVISLYRDGETARVLRSFCTILGASASTVMLILWVLGVDKWFFGTVLDAQPEVLALAHLGFISPLLTPIIGALQSYVRGMLTAHHLTVSRLVAVAVNIVCFGAALLLGVLLQGNGAIFSGLALSFALAAELTVLIWFWRRSPVARQHRAAAL